MSRAFSELASGKLASKGLLVPKLNHSDWDEDQRAKIRCAPLENIDKRKWSMKNTDFYLSRLVPGESVFYGVQVSVPEMFSIFPTPLFKSSPVQGEKFGGTILLPTDGPLGSPTPGPKRQGRLPMAGGAIETAVRNEFLTRFKEGSLPKKKEAVIAEVTGWVERIFEENISRSTAQRYLAPVFAQKPAQKPK